MSAECNDCGRDIEYPAGSWPLGECSYCRLADERDAALEAIDLVDTPYPLEVFPERSDEQRDAIFAAMREVDPYATEWFYAHVARERGRVARDSLAARSPSRTEREQ